MSDAPATSWPPAPPDAVVEKLVIGRAPFARPVGSLFYCLSMIFSENRCTLFRIMLWVRRTPQFCNDSSASSARTGLAGRTMEFSTGFGWTRLPVLAAALIFGSVLTASAQIIPPTPPAAAVPDEEAEDAPD